MPEAERWLAEQPKLPNGKVDIRLLVAEGQKRGYCICPVPMRQMINVDGLTHQWCGMRESRESWKFWYGDD
jgi:hypothetical protein